MNVIVLKEKLDALAEAIGIKSKVRLPLTIDEQIEAVNLIKTDPKLQDKSVSLTPKATAQTATVTPDNGYDGLGEVAVKVKEAPLTNHDQDLSAGSYTFTPSAPYIGYSSVSVNVNNGTVGTVGILGTGYVDVSGIYKWYVRPYANISKAGWINKGDKYGNYTYYDALQANTTITPSTETQTVGGANVMMKGAITVNPIPSNYGLITYNGTTITVS